MTNLVGIVDKVVMWQGYSFGVACGSRGKLDIARMIHLDLVGQVRNQFPGVRPGIGRHVLEPERSIHVLLRDYDDML